MTPSPVDLSLLNLLIVLLAAWLAGQLVERIGYPAVLGELLAGIVLGPPLLGLIENDPALAVLAEVGILLMMFYIGLEIDPGDLGKASKAGFLAAIGGFVTPFVLAYLVIVWTGGTQTAAVFVGIAAGVTALATKSRILLDLQLLDTRIAHVMMAGALIADTLSLFIFAGLLSVAETSEISAMELLSIAAKAVVFFAVAALVGWKGFPWLGRRLKQAATLERHVAFLLFVLIVFAFAELAEIAGMHGILGAFLAGLFLREKALGRVLSKDLLGLMRVTSLGFLAPVFFVTAGFAVTLDVFTSSLSLLVLIIAVGTVGKIAGVTLFYLPTGHGWREGLTIGAGMNGRGAVEIIVAQIGLSAGLISQELFSILVVMAIFTTATVPILLKWGTAWLERRGELVRSSKERIGYLIVGAGPTARALAQELARSHPVHLIDRNKENCARALAEGLRAIQGNALEEDVLNEAGATRIRACIVMTANAEVNAMIAQTARTVFFVPEISVIGSREGAGHDAMTHHLKAETLFGSPRDLVAWDYRLDNGQVRRNTVSIERPIVPPDLPLEGLASDACLPFVYEKGGVVFPFFSGSRLDLGDRLTLLQVNEASAAGRDRFDRIVAGAPVLDIAQRMELGAFFSFVAGVLAPRLAQPAERLADLFVQRERHHPSVLLPGLAIPHILVEHAPAFEVVVIRARIGVVFPGEAEPVHALFVLAGPPEERTFHLRALSAIAQIVQSPSFERDWFQARDSEALRQLILQAERQRFPVETAGPGDGSGM